MTEQEVRLICREEINYAFRIVAMGFVVTIILGIVILVTLLLIGCNSTNGQSPAIDPRTVQIGQPCPAEMKQVLVSRTKWNDATVDEWQFVLAARFYRVQVVADTVTYLQSTKTEW